MDATRRTTIRDIAALAGVSAGTVSRAINGKAGVGESTRLRIEEIVAAQGFAMNSSARRLSTGRSQSLAVVFPLHASEVVMHPVYPALLGAFCDSAESAEYDVMLLTVPSPDRIGHLIDAVQRRKVDGVVLPAAGPRDPLVHAMAKIGTPTVVMGQRSRVPGVCWVDCTHDRAAHDLALLMARQGRRRLTLVNGPSRVAACRLRSQGFWRGVREAGAMLDSATEVECDFDAGAGRATADELFSQDKAPDGLICGSDTIAAGCLDAAREHGLVVPGDVAVSGFDDHEIARHTTPALTSVRMPLQATGEVAARLLISLIEGRPVASTHVVLPTELVLRESTAPAG